MSKRLILVLTLAFVVGIAFSAYAEVQNVKVGGDILIRQLNRTNFSLTKSTTVGDKENDKSNRFMSAVRVNISADLTDNVSTVIRLLNERAWGLENSGAAGTASSTAIDLDLAYVVLKEFLYSPLTLQIGRQELNFGNKLVVGSGNSYTNTNQDSNTAFNNGVPNDLRLRKAWDAIRATLDYDPLKIDLVYGLYDEGGTTRRNDNIELYGVNAAYKFSKKTSVEGYIFSKQDGKTAEADVTAPTGKRDQVHTIGILGRTEPINNLKTSLELAYQFGKRVPTGTTAASGSTPAIPGDTSAVRRAYAIQAMADYAFKGKKYDPAVGASVTFLSGDNQRGDKIYRAWDAMYEGQVPNIVSNAVLPNSACTVINLKGKIKPASDITLNANYGYYHFNQRLNETGLINSYARNYMTMTESKDGGSALDLTAKYDYTEDVQFGLDIGTFMPGKAFYDARTATQVMTSMKVTF